MIWRRIGDLGGWLEARNCEDRFADQVSRENECLKSLSSPQVPPPCPLVGNLVCLLIVTCHLLRREYPNVPQVLMFGSAAMPRDKIGLSKAS